MRRLRASYALPIAAICLAAAAPVAESAWKSVTLAGRPGFTIDVPATVTQVPNSSADELMNFEAETGDGATEFSCVLMRKRYAADFKRVDVIGLLGSDQRRKTCPGDPAAAHYNVISLAPTTSNGFPAATCAASYTEASGDKPGVAATMMVVAGSDAAYFLQCLLNNEYQSGAEDAYRQAFKDRIEHIQSSFHLPRDAR